MGDDIARIAKGLTEAQRRSLVLAVKQGAPWARCQIGGPSWVASEALEVRKLVHRSDAYVLPTTLGRAVAEYLEGKQ